MNIFNNLLKKDISELFGFDGMTEEEKADFLDSVGSAMIESSILRYLSNISDERVVEFESFLEEFADDEEVFEKLLDRFPEFETILTEEIADFKIEAQEVLET